MNTETPSLQLLRTQYGQANIVQQKSQLVAFYLKNYIITKTIDFLKSERSQGKDISEMTADVHNWFQDLEGVKQSLGSQLQDMDTCRQQFFDFTYYHFSRCDAQYKNNVRSQQLADELASVLLLTEAYSIFNAPDQQVDHMRNVARTAYTEVLKNAQTNPKFQPTYSTYSQPSNQGIMYHGNELETPNPDMNNTAASIRQGPSQGQSIANQNQLHSIKTPGGPTTGVSALSGFQMVESSFVSKDTLTQNRSQATNMQSQHQNLQSQNRPGLQSQAYQNPNQSIRGPGNQNAPFSGFQPVQSVVVTQGSLNQQQAAAQDKELTHFDDLLASLQPGNIQASQHRQSQVQGPAGHGLQSVKQPGTNDNNQGAFSGFNMAESNYVPQQSIGQNQQGQAGPSGFQGVQSIRQAGPNNNNQGAFSGFNMAESNYVSRDAIGNKSQQGGPGGFPQNVQGYNQSQQSYPNRMEVEGPGVPFGQGVLRSQAYNPNAGNFNNNALPDFTRMQNDPTNIPNRDGTSQSNAPYQPFDFKQSSHPNQPGPGLIPGFGQQNFLGQNAGIQGNREEPFAQENKKDVSKALPSRQGGGANTGPALNLPNDKYNLLKELCRMTISELDYKNVKEAKDNIRKALSIIREHNPGM